MTCGDREQALNAWADGQLGFFERRELAAHVQACADCALQLRLLRAMKSAVAAVPAPALPADLKASLLQAAGRADRALAAKRRQRRREAVTVWLTGRATGFGLAAGLAAAVLIFALRAGGPGETVALDDMLAAHRSYALTMPLTSQETVMTGLADALAGGRP